MQEPAGIDFGSTLIKAYWQKDGADCFATLAHKDGLAELWKRLERDGVTRLRLVGAGARSQARPPGFTTVQAGPGAIDDEIRLQALGARYLMGKAPRRMLVASIGTGVSYAKVSGRKAVRYPLGSCHGGGTILGLGRIVGANTFREIEEAAGSAEPGDLLVKHKLPETDGTPIGELVIAHFTKADASFEEKCASVFNFAACSIVKDLAVLTSIPFSPKEIAVVGTVADSRVFRGYLGRWMPMLKGCRVHFPAQGGFAAAVGAWADISR